MVKSVEYTINWNNFNQKKTDNDKKQKIFCDKDGEYRIYCHVCDKLAMDRYHNNHQKSQTHINNFRERQHLINTSNSTSSKYYYYKTNIKRSY